MHVQEAADWLEHRARNLQRTNLVCLHYPVRYTPQDPARLLAERLGATPISVIGTLHERFADRWPRLIEAERRGALEQVQSVLADDLAARVRERNPAIICDTQVLYAFPELALTAHLYPLSEGRVVALALKAARTREGLRLLIDGPTYPTANCTVLEMED